MNWFRIVGILPLLFVAFSKSEDPPSVGYAFSTYGLQKLSMREQKILPILTKYINVASTNLETLKRFDKITHSQQDQFKIWFLKVSVESGIRLWKLFKKLYWD